MTEQIPENIEVNGQVMVMPDEIKANIRLNQLIALSANAGTHFAALIEKGVMNYLEAREILKVDEMLQFVREANSQEPEVAEYENEGGE